MRDGPLRADPMRDGPLRADPDVTACCAPAQHVTNTAGAVAS
jgi:hypothetical protein